MNCVYTNRMGAIKWFSSGIDEKAFVDVNFKFSFVCVGNENVAERKGTAVRTFKVSNSMKCMEYLKKLTGKTWKLVES